MSWFVQTGIPGKEKKGSGTAKANTLGVRNTIGSDFKPGALESTMHWQVIWPRAIALAWEDEYFHAALKENPRKAIHETFGYLLNDALELKIVDAPANAEFDSGTESAKVGDPWAKLPPLKLTITIPPAPPVDLQAVAITTYQDTGRTYPFTCC